MQEKDWTYLAIIHSNNSYGRGGVAKLLAEEARAKICYPEVIAVDGQAEVNVSHFEDVLREHVYRTGSIQRPPINGILVFGTFALAKTVLEAAQIIATSNDTASDIKPTFLLSEASGYLEGDQNPMALGVYILSPNRRSMAEYRNHLKRVITQDLHSENNTYFKQMYEQTTNCSFAQSSCSPLETTQYDASFPDSVYNQYAIQAAFVTAKAIERVRSKVCDGVNAATCISIFQNTSASPRSLFIKALREQPINFDLEFGNLRLETYKSENVILGFSDTGDPVVSPVDTVHQYEIYNHQACQSHPCLKKVCLI